MKYIVLICMCIVSTSFAQVRQASVHLQDNEPEKARELLIPYLESHPSDSAALFLMGRISLAMKEWDSAATYFEAAGGENYPKSEIHYYQAKRILLEKGVESQALGELEAGSFAGMRHYIPLTQDPIFAPLRSSDRWKDLLTRVEKNTYPCMSDPNYRHFDFWLGNWDVYVNDVKRGENRITMANGGCAIHESYTTYPRDYTGQSINFYDPIDKLWHQHWVGSGGDVTNYLETSRGPGMLEFTGNILNAAGNTVINRMTFTILENGDVRQRIETSRDNQKTWTTSFDGIYKRKG
jgi:hypothetical protein